jgi:hypothetical protein
VDHVKLHTPVAMGAAAQCGTGLPWLSAKQPAAGGWTEQCIWYVLLKLKPGASAGSLLVQIRGARFQLGTGLNTPHF